MTKRSEHFESHATKKTKTEDFNDCWGEDLDIQAVDDCFERATQIYNQELSGSHDVSHLSSYSIFIKSNNIPSSTQIPHYSNRENVEDEIKELRQKYEEREGEVSILRANLKNLKTNWQLEQEKKQNEFKEKLLLSQKENKAVKSQLEFKNLEVANLKQQIAELTRLVNNDQSSSQKPKVAENKSIPENKIQVSVINPKIHINSRNYYPLKSCDFSFLFKPLLKHQNLNSHLHNQLQDSDLNYICLELSHFVNLSREEFDTETSQLALNKIISASLHLLDDFYNCMKRIESNMQPQESSTFQLQNNEKRIMNERSFEFINISKTGIKLGKIFWFLAEILPFSTNFKNYLLMDRLLNLKDSKIQKLNYLSTLLNIISIIGKTRKEHLCTEFLTGTIKLLTAAFNSGEFYSPNSNLICNVTTEILFLNLDVDNIFHVTFLMKSASKNPVFMDTFCCKSPKSSCLNKDSCKFQVFVLLLENVLLKIEDETVLIEISDNVLIFIYNVFKLNSSWLYQQESNKCECLRQLYKLTIGIIYKNLNTYQELNSNSHVNYIILFKNSVKVLNLLIFNSYDLTQKYVMDFAKFKEIMYTMSRLCRKIGLDEEDLKNLEKLDASEDSTEISNDKFVGIEL